VLLTVSHVKAWHGRIVEPDTSIDHVIQRVITRSHGLALVGLAHGLGVKGDHEISPPIGRVLQDGTEFAQRLDG
jgi:hypothetical protein